MNSFYLLKMYVYLFLHRINLTYLISCDIIITESEVIVMAKFLGRAQTVDELIEMIKPYSGFNIFLEGCDYNSPEVYVYCDEEEKTIELN